MGQPGAAWGSLGQYEETLERVQVMWGSIGSMGQHEETLQRAQAVWGIMGQHVAAWGNMRKHFKGLRQCGEALDSMGQHKETL